MIHELNQMGFVFETTMEEATPQPDAEDDDEGGFIQLEDSEWRDSTYNLGEDRRDGGDQAGDDH